MIMPQKVMKAARITVQGVVQGVGFRPFVYRLAHEHHLTGRVQNTSQGVDIRVEGNETLLNKFLDALKNNPPPMARIESIRSIAAAPEGFSDFRIEESRQQSQEYQLISPDIATCQDCRREIFTPGDRRFRYAFTNCTNCGPRFTIIEDMPYDRPKTTMGIFRMCPQCQREYDDPSNRRFHAQPNACPVCGPHLELRDKDERLVECADVITESVRLLKTGQILALKGLGGFQLACDATDQTAVDRLRERKHRPAKPFAVMLPDIDTVHKYCELSREEQRVLESPESPIVLLKIRGNISGIRDSVAPGLTYLGVLLPYTPLHLLLMQETKRPLIMTSGNISEEPITGDNDEAFRRLQGIADYFLLHNRDIYSVYDDSVVIVEEAHPQTIRRARGYAPYPVFLPYISKQILACGAEEKNTFCLTRDNHAFLSQHIGDMENEATLEHFENTLEIYKYIFRIQPEIIACDQHPEYLSTKYARQCSSKSNLPLVPVQHHHAHIVSCMLDNRIQQPVIGVAFDGTGYGTDGAMWGGEFLIADCRSFTRAGHLQYVPLPGGTAAIKKPFRMALSYLRTLLGDALSLEYLPLQKYASAEFDIVQQQLLRHVNSPMTSSAGRLFDALAALLGICGEISYEAQAAVGLEMLATDAGGDGSSYSFEITTPDNIKIITLTGLFEEIIADIRHKVPERLIAYKFHVTMAHMISKVCRLIASETGIGDIVLSGGVFQNRLLQRLVLAELREKGYNVFTHHSVPCNDGGISLGQAAIANYSEIRE